MRVSSPRGFLFWGRCPFPLIQCLASCHAARAGRCTARCGNCRGCSVDILDFTHFLLDFWAISNFWISHDFGKILPNFSSKLQLVYKPVGSVQCWLF